MSARVTAPADAPADARRTNYRKALSWSAVMVGGQQVLTAALSLLLARILGPSSFGLVAIATIYILFMQMVLQQIAPSIIQRDDLQSAHIDSAFWLVLAMTVVISGVSVALSGPFAALNRTPDLQPIIIALSLLVPLEGLVVVQEALLRRRMEFRSLAVRELVAAGIGGIVGIVMAFRGAGAWALVWQQLTNQVVGTIVLWSVSNWRPRLRFSWSHTRELLGFSVGSFLANLASFVNVRSDAILIGLFFGPLAVGVYRLASRFTEIFVDFLSRSMMQVAFPELSRLQKDVRAFGDRMFEIMSQSGLLTIPALGILAGCAGQLERLFGPEWHGVAPTLRLLCIAAAVKALSLISSAGLQAIGRPHVLAMLSWLAGIVSAVSLVAVGLPLRRSSLDVQVSGMAASRVALFVLVIGPVFVVVIDRCCGLGARRLLGAIVGPALVGAGAGAVGLLWTESRIDRSWPPLGALASVGVVTGLAALTLLALVDRHSFALVGGVAKRILRAPAWVPDRILGVDAYQPRHMASPAVYQSAPTRPRYVNGKTYDRAGADPLSAGRRADQSTAPLRPQLRAINMRVSSLTGGLHGSNNGIRQPTLSHGATSVDLWTSLGVIARRWKISVPLILLTALSSLFIGGSISPDYEGRAVVMLVGPGSGTPVPGSGTTGGSSASSSTTTTATTAPSLTPTTVSSGDEANPNPLLTLNGSLNSNAQATLQSLTDDDVVRRLRENGLSTSYELEVAQNDPILSITVTDSDAETVSQTVQALIGAVADDLQNRQDQAGVPADARMSAQTLSETNQPRALYENRRRAQLVIVALGLALTAIVVFAVEGLTERRSRTAAAFRESMPTYGPAGGDDAYEARAESVNGGRHVLVGQGAREGSDHQHHQPHGEPLASSRGPSWAGRDDDDVDQR
jgi:O-antigen/teichoic acid export membrane protein